MTIKSHLFSSVCMMLAACSTVMGLAQEKDPKTADPYAFSIRVYRLPSDELSVGFVSKERGKLRAPALPGANSSNGEIEVFIKRSHDVVKDYLAQQGIVLPKGSLACYDPASGTLALRAMSVIHDLVQPFAESVLNQLPNHVAWSLDILEAKSSASRAAMKEAIGQSDHTAVYDHLLPQSKIVVTMRGETKSGQQATASQGGKMENAVEYELDEKNRVEYTREDKRVGTQIELEPTVGADSQTLDLNVALTHRHAGGTPRWDTLSATTAEKIQARWMDHPLAEVKTTLTLKGGQAKMLGIWALDGTTEPERADTVRIAFLRAAIVNAQPLENLRLEQMLKSRGEAVDATPKAVRPVADPSLPPGMSVRRFRIPPDFLSSGGGQTMSAAAPADPFAAGAAPNEPRFLRRVTAEDILRAQGIPFPDGASANFLPVTSELVCRNTSANLDLIEAFVRSLIEQKPKTLTFSLHVVQADAAMIRQLDRSTFGIPDHSAAWKMIEEATAQGKAKILRSAWLETKSGQQCTAESVIEYMQGTGTEIGGGTSTTETKKPAANEEVKSAPVATATVTNNTGGYSLYTGTEITPVGLRIEIEPVLGADGRTVDVNMAIDYDYALPVQHHLDDAPPEKTLQLAAPLTEFRKQELKTATAMRDGSTRLISVWKPSGTPELDGDVLQAAFLRVDVVPLSMPGR